MFKHTNGSRESMKDMLLELDGNKLEVILAQQAADIYFMKAHLQDLKTLIGAGSNSS